MGQPKNRERWLGRLVCGRCLLFMGTLWEQNLTLARTLAHVLRGLQLSIARVDEFESLRPHHVSVCFQRVSP